MKGSVNLFEIRGIQVRLHFTLLVILPIIAWFFSTTSQRFVFLTVGFGEVPVDPSIKFLFGVVAAIVFFISILLHELGHSYVARRRGLSVKSITLFLFGGVAALEIPRNTKAELGIALAGPLVSFAIGIILVLAGLVGL